MHFDQADRQLALDMLGTDDATAIEAAIGAFCREQLGRGMARVRSWSLSAGAGFGLGLADGQSVFLKAWSPATPRTSLESVHVVQHALATRGFPAPRVLVNPRPFMRGHAVIMQWCELGTQLDAHAPPVRRAMATSLAHLIALATPFADRCNLPQHDYPAHGTWGPTHNVLFDFHATRRGAEWIDEVATASALIAQRGSGRRVVGHRDWSVKNMRFHGDPAGNPVVSAVYDWDSLAVARETDVVGMAAATFTVTWELPVVPLFPTRDEMAAFVADYEAAAGRRFSANEWECIGAAATYVLAYIARCEHCAGGPEVTPSARALLRSRVAESSPFARLSSML